MDFWSDWTEDATMDVYRVSSSIADNESSESEAQIYTDLKITIEGKKSDLQHTILGDIALGEKKVFVLVGNIDENGWPQVGDRCVISGKSYTIASEEDSTQSPGIFTAIPQHKAYDLAQDV